MTAETDGQHRGASLLRARLDESPPVAAAPQKLQLPGLVGVAGVGDGVIYGVAGDAAIVGRAPFGEGDW